MGLHNQAELFDAAYDDTALTAELCKKSLSYFIQNFWQTCNTSPLIWNWHLDYLTEQLTKLAKQLVTNTLEKQNVIINVPPGTTKSMTISVMFPVWCWVNWSWMRFICTSYTNPLSLELAEKSRNVVRSSEFERLFPHLSIKVDKDQKGNFELQMTDEKGIKHPAGNRFSTSVGGTVTGYHGNVLIIDDPINPAGTDSDAERIKANRWLDQTLSTRKIDIDNTLTILVMQRLHEDDPTGHFLEELGDNVFHICLPGEIIDYEANVKPKELKANYIDGVLDIRRRPYKALMDLKQQLGQYGYAGQIGQSPTAPEGGMFQVDNIETIYFEDTPKIIRSIRYWDKAGTAVGIKAKSNATCWTCGTLIGKGIDDKFYIMDVVRGRWDTFTRERIIRRTAEDDSTNVVVYIEQEPGSGGKESAERTIRSLAGFSVYADRPTGDKTLRADPFSVQVNGGNVCMIKGEWNKEFLNEMRTFPFSRYKDQVDSSSGAFNKLTRKKKARVIY